MRPSFRDLALAAILLAGCLRATPFETELDPEDTDQNARNIARIIASRPARPFKLAFISDTHTSYDELSAVVDALNARSDIDFVAVGGDLTDYGLLQEFEWALRGLRKLNVPFVTAVGNHDALSSGSYVFRRMFGPYDTSFVYGSTKLVFFNTNGLEFPYAPDLDWLERELTGKGDADAVILVTHQPPDGEGIPLELRSRYMDLQSDHGVILDLHGHVSRNRVSRHGNTAYLNLKPMEDSAFAIIEVDGRDFTYQWCTPSGCSPPARVP
jgi:3',5'-cyclic-AMP phosphodiesterase